MQFHFRLSYGVPLVSLFNVLQLLQNMSVAGFQVPHFNERRSDIKHPLLTTSVGITLAGVRVVCVPVPGRAQSVLTCVTCASVVWLVDWINIGWVSSCPAGIVTCCI